MESPVKYLVDLPFRDYGDFLPSSDCGRCGHVVSLGPALRRRARRLLAAPPFKQIGIGKDLQLGAVEGDAAFPDLDAATRGLHGVLFAECSRWRQRRPVDGQVGGDIDAVYPVCHKFPCRPA